MGTGRGRAVGRALPFVMLVAIGCHAGEREATVRLAEPPSQAVRTATIARTAAGHDALAPGVVLARRHATLAARLQATVVSLPLREGERVAAGTIVARLDDTALQSALAAAEAGMGAAEADRRRMQALLARGAATPREAEEAEARAAAARAAREAAKDNLSYAVLRAPYAGAIAAVPVHVGDVIAPGVPVIEVEAEGGYEVRATVEGSVAALLRPGSSADAEIDGQPKALNATVRSVAPAADPTSHRFEVRADLPLDPGLRSGLFARLRVQVPEGDARLLVPESAIVRRGGLTGLFAVSEGHARLRWVALGEVKDGRAEIRAGAYAGETIVLDPSGLDDGRPVHEGR